MMLIGTALKSCCQRYQIVAMTSPLNALLVDTQISEELDQQKHIRIPAYTNLPFLAVGGVSFLPPYPNVGVFKQEFSIWKHRVNQTGNKTNEA